ncbi:hypothetical protein K2P97_12445 [bacterium]|nr:hypothetical protein [bacterium]
MKSWIADIVDEELLSQMYLHESNSDFIERVCSLCLDEIESRRGYAPAGYGADVIEEIENQVTEIFRVKIYGFYNLQEYRKHQLKKQFNKQAV